MLRFKTDDILSIAALMEKGGLCVFPTDTVYGIGGVYDNPMVLPKIYGAKHRDIDKKIPLLVSDAEMITEFIADEIPRDMRRLIQLFSPGALTYVLPGKESMREFAASDGSIGVRIPNSPFLRQLIKKLGKPLLATSANLSGHPELKTQGELERTFMNSADGIVIGHQNPDATPSTIISFAEDLPRFLRIGAIPKEDIRRYITTKTHITFVCTGNTCRSPLAEFYAKKILSQRLYHVESAGTSAVDGMDMAHFSKKLVEEFGLNPQKSAQQLTPHLVRLSDIMLTMEVNHSLYIQRNLNACHVFLLNDFAVNRGSIHANGVYEISNQFTASEIADPVGKDYSIYQQTLGEIAGALDSITWDTDNGKETTQ